MRSVFTFVLLASGTLTAGPHTAQMNMKVQRRDPDGWLNWYTPRRPPLVRSQGGSWQCYPVIMQGIKHESKALLLRIGVMGPRHNWGDPKEIVINVDGECKRAPLAADEVKVNNAMHITQYVEITLVHQADLVEQIGRAHAVSVTLTDRAGNDHGVRLSDKQLLLIREALEYYRDLEPIDQPAK